MKPLFQRPDIENTNQNYFKVLLYNDSKNLHGNMMVETDYCVNDRYPHRRMESPMQYYYRRRKNRGGREDNIIREK